MPEEQRTNPDELLAVLLFHSTPTPNRVIANRIPANIKRIVIRVSRLRKRMEFIKLSQKLSFMLFGGLDYLSPTLKTLPNPASP